MVKVPPIPDVLPDSRPQRVKGAVNRAGAWWVPIACANCGADGGLVPEENVTFAFYLCNACAEKWGTLANTLCEPDAVFWERVRQEQLSKYQRLLSPDELKKIVEANASPLATLLRKGT